LRLERPKGAGGYKVLEQRIILKQAVSRNERDERNAKSGGYPIKDIHQIGLNLCSFKYLNFFAFVASSREYHGSSSTLITRTFPETPPSP
jgi:hypothetical protein